MCTSQGLLLLVADQVDRKAFNVFSHATVFSWVGEVGRGCPCKHCIHIPDRDTLQTPKTCAFGSMFAVLSSHTACDPTTGVCCSHVLICCRFQYLELAYYLIHGHCPPQTPQGYILSTAVRASPSRALVFQPCGTSLVLFDTSNVV